MEQYLFILAALVVGVVIGRLIKTVTTGARIAIQTNTIAQLQQQLQEQQQLSATLAAQITQQQNDATTFKTLYQTSSQALNELKLEKIQLSNDLLRLKAAQAQDAAVLRAEQEKLLMLRQDYEGMKTAQLAQFETLANTIMEKKTQQFSTQNGEQMKHLLEPLKTQLVDFKQKVEQTYDAESKERFALGKHIERLMDMSRLVSQEANNLTTALKGNVKQQGNWGEMILESILEHSGLTKNREYFTQDFIKDTAGNIIKDEQGRGLQPDVTICYPDQRKIIVDSKVSLLAWEAYIAANDVASQQQHLQDHIKSIRQHIDGLAKKDYPRYAKALDYVLLFIPIEPAFLEAVKQDNGLWKYAYDKKIMLVSPTNLLAVLKIIADLWKVELQNRNAIDIADKAGLLYNKFVSFVENLEDVGKKITAAQQSYDDAFKQLSTGRGNLVSKVEELKKMGANAQKNLPDRLLMELKIDET
ncbi:DNA recombination protein RmuC [Parasediminibacterium paludis]|uniref:DNA recombination protein RmuC n=1 Tax=Parasediminibacterium paludis TaxID=908966 RepID=A0ABV8PVI7_9BACT